MNPDLLSDLNRIELAKQINDHEKCKELIKQVRTIVKEKYPMNADQLDLDDDHIMNVLKWGSAASRISTLNDLTDESLAFLWVLPKIAKDKEISLNEGNINRGEGI